MRAALLLLAACALGCEAPPVVPGADLRQNASAGRIEGQVIVDSAARGKVVLFLYDAARPPPPEGAGRPLTFTVVSRDDVFGPAPDGDAGPFTAPFAFSLVAPGRYLVRGFVDADDDFIPWYGATADTSAGDVGGAAIDPVTQTARVVTVRTDEAGAPVPALGVPVRFSDAERVPLDRPAFAVVGAPGPVTLAGQPRLVELEATPLVEGVVRVERPGFLLRLLDEDGDGVADDANGDGVPDVWPRVVARKVQQEGSPLVDENDLDGDGVVDAAGVDYARAAGGLDGAPDAVVLEAAFDVREYAAQLVDAAGRPRPTPLLVTRLKLVLQPRALDASAPAQPAPLAAVPPGRYAITVIQQTGQAWRVPNELGVETPGLPSVATQGVVIEVP